MSCLSKRRPNWLDDLVMSPYSLREGIGCVWRNLFPNWSNPRRLEFCPQVMQRHAGTELLRIGFIGDIMDIAGHPLQLDDSVPAFFADCDAVVGNMEACIASPKKHPQQNRHDERIIDDLRPIADPAKFHLSVANNHAADFGEPMFRESVRKFRAAGYHVFGTREEPFVDIGDHLRVVTGSVWTNMTCNWIADFNDITRHHAPGRFNVLFPHWGYEMEYAPRPEILDLGMNFLQTADAIIGHHSHLPQPMFWCEAGGREKLFAPSLGDFCCRYRYAADDFYKFGVVLKLTLGRLDTGGLDVLSMQWRFVEGLGGQQFVKVTLRDAIDLPPLRNS